MGRLNINFDYAEMERRMASLMQDAVNQGIKDMWAGMDFGHRRASGIYEADWADAARYASTFGELHPDFIAVDEYRPPKGVTVIDCVARDVPADRPLLNSGKEE